MRRGRPIMDKEGDDKKVCLFESKVVINMSFVISLLKQKFDRQRRSLCGADVAEVIHQTNHTENGGHVINRQTFLCEGSYQVMGRDWAECSDIATFIN